MAELRDTIAYLCKNYPHKWELSKARLTKMVYLADWKSALDRGQQITEIGWRFNHFGPYVEDVVDIAREDPDFTIVHEHNMYGDPKDVVSVREDVFYPSLSPQEIDVLNHVIEKTAPKDWDDFIRLIYSTYPILTQERYTRLNLVHLAQRYREDLTLF